jgi:hypothetical protein
VQYHNVGGSDGNGSGSDGGSGEPTILVLSRLSSEAVAALGSALDAAARGSMPLLTGSALYAR